MFLTCILYLQALKWFAPTVMILGAAPTFCTVWSAWRVLSAVLPYRIYRRGDDKIYSSYQRMILFFFEHYNGLQVHLYGDVDKVLEKKESVFYISNHQSTVDWIVSDMLAIRQGSLGHLRYILKDGLKYFPLYGFYFGQHGGVYVKRSGKFEESKAAKTLSLLEKHKVPTWMVVFPEGTRYNPELPDVIKKSQDFARAEGFQVLNYVLTPRHKAVYVGLRHLRQSLDAIYDVTIGYSNTVNKEGQRKLAVGMPDFLSGNSPPQVHLHIQRFPMEDIPEDITGLREWLHNRFVEKEKLMEHFYNNKDTFPGQAVRSKISLMSTLPSFVLWTGLTSAFFITDKGRSFYWKYSLGLILGYTVWVRLRY